MDKSSSTEILKNACELENSEGGIYYLSSRMSLHK